MNNSAAIPWLILSNYRWTRIAVFTSFYVAQGIPIGLFTVALPIYLANAGYGVAEISLYGMWIGLPWAFKLVAGPFMDRFTYLAMGFRRPWVIGAQSGLVFSMLLLAIAAIPGDPSLFWLTTFGFLCNVFSASQDVATDGMAIDLLHDDERGKANAFMAMGQTVGYSAFGGLSGYLLVSFNVFTTAFVATLLIGVIWAIAVITRERPGEKTLPWTAGQAADTKHARDKTFLEVFKDLVKVLFLPMSIILVLVEFFNRMRDGVALAVIPVYASQVFNVGTDVYAYFNMVIGLSSAAFGLVVGPIIDRIGGKQVLFLALLISAAIHLVAWAGAEFGMSLTVMAWIYTFGSLVGQVIFVAIIAIFMTICWDRVSATQFSIYMSLANLSRTIGSGLFAIIAPALTFAEDFLLMAGLLGIAAITLIFFNVNEHKQRMAVVDSAHGDKAGEAA